MNKKEYFWSERNEELKKIDNVRCVEIVRRKGHGFQFSQCKNKWVKKLEGFGLCSKHYKYKTDRFS